jgi:hypothetical protein
MMTLLSTPEQLLVVSSAILWLGLAVNLVVSVALMRLVGGLHATHSAPSTRRISIGSPIPDFRAQELSSGRPVDRATLMGRPHRLLFLTPECERCLRAVEWAIKGDGDWTFMVAADASRARAVGEVLASNQVVLCEADGPFKHTFELPAFPFMIVTDQIGTIIEAGPVEDPADLEIGALGRHLGY